MNELNGSSRSLDSAVHHWKLVVADDMAVNADSLSDLLRLHGHEVATVYDGNSAVAAFETFRPHAYVLDLGMPGLDGFETCSAIRNLPGGDSVAIIALSGWGRNEDLTRALAAGFSGYLLKPAHPREVLRCLSTTWPRRNSADSDWRAYD